MNFETRNCVQVIYLRITSGGTHKEVKGKGGGRGGSQARSQWRQIPIEGSIHVIQQRCSGEKAIAQSHYNPREKSRAFILPYLKVFS
jgi:hypothetical protein